LTPNENGFQGVRFSSEESGGLEDDFSFLELRFPADF